MRRGARTISFRRSACGRRVLARWSCERRGAEIVSGRRRLVVIESERAERPAGGAHDATARQRRARAEGARRVRQSKPMHLYWLGGGRVGRQDESSRQKGPVDCHAAPHRLRRAGHLIAPEIRMLPSWHQMLLLLLLRAAHCCTTAICAQREEWTGSLVHAQ